MAYQALYRKYRPTTFDDVVGQEHITRTLRNELAAGHVFHAYLFTGTRGTGKTTCAKILAKAVNCLAPVEGNPCGTCEVCRAIQNGDCTDVAEIDAASNNSVDDIRALREQVNFLPSDAGYRVYIIDEVHMLSDAAFNALLKTLEEPPAHVVFVLATTEVHKLPATILSRCQRFDFHRIDNKDIIRRLLDVAAAENVTLSEPAARLIAAAADGGMRDALSILDLCLSYSHDVEEETVITACGMAGKEPLFALADALIKHNAGDALDVLDRLYAGGVDMLRLLYDLTAHFRDLMIVKTVQSEQRPLVCSSTDLAHLEEQASRFSLETVLAILQGLQAAVPGMQLGDRRLQMEITLIRLCAGVSSGNEDLVARIERLERQWAGGVSASPPPPSVTEEPTPSPSDLPDATADELSLPAQAPAAQPEPLSSSLPDDATESPADGRLGRWPTILGKLRVTCPLTIGVLEGSTAYIKGDLLLIDAPNPLFRNMMNNNAVMRDSIRQAVEEVLHRSYRLGPYVRPAGVSQKEDDPLAKLAEQLKGIEESS